VTVVSVVDPLLAEAARVRLGQDLVKEETEPALREFAAASWTSTTPSPTQLAFKTPIGNAAGSILDAAETERADLIVVGTQGLGGLRKWLLGSTTERLLRQTKVPVLAVPSPEGSAVRDADPVAHVLAAMDFSRSSDVAAQIAAHWARALSAKLTLLHVVEPVSVPPQWVPLLEESDETRVGSARARLHALAEQICGSQLCDEVVAFGRPADVIGSTAVQREARLIVMGLASEQGTFSPRPGSIAYRVLSSTTVPVLVVPTT
jgi:nucleotide-binding universal stress UspA family protein